MQNCVVEYPGGAIFGLHSLSLRGCMFKDSYSDEVQFSRLDIFRSLNVKIIAKLIICAWKRLGVRRVSNHCLIKTKMLRSQQFPSELAGLGFNVIYNICIYSYQYIFKIQLNFKPDTIKWDYLSLALNLFGLKKFSTVKD